MLEAAARSKRGEQDIALLIELATLIWKRLNQPDMAESFFRRVRKLDASNHEMVEFYREYYTAKNELPQLLTVLAQAQKTEGDVERRVAMGIEMARAAEARPQHAEKAIEIWKGILRLKPHLPEAVTSLRALYTRTEKWNALLELLKDDLDVVPGGGRRRKDQPLPRDRRHLSRSLEPRRDGGEHLPQHPGAQARSPGGAGGAGRRATRRRGATATSSRS